MGVSSSYDLGSLDDGLDTFGDDGMGSVLAPYGGVA